MRWSISAMACGSQPISGGARTWSMAALAPHTVSPLQRGMTVASPTPSIPASVPIRTSTYSDTVCCPRAEIMRRSGFSGIRTANVSMCVMRMPLPVVQLSACEPVKGEVRCLYSKQYRCCQRREVRYRSAQIIGRSSPRVVSRGSRTSSHGEFLKFRAVTRIFTTLALCSTAVLVAALWLGLDIGDAHLRDSAVQSRVTFHFLTGVAALVFAVLVHALVITYFMGTGRWLQETCAAYRLGADWQARSRDLKWRLYPVVGASLLLLIAT